MNVFFNNLGVSSAELAFTGSYGVQGSVYDSVTYVTKYADPNFIYSKAVAQIWAGVVFRLVDDSILPIKLASYSQAISVYLAAVKNMAQTRGFSLNFDALSAALDAFSSRCQATDAAIDSLRKKTSVDSGVLAIVNSVLFGVERAFITFDGQRDRPWYVSQMASSLWRRSAEQFVHDSTG